ncbi:MAG: hypothetical protein H0W68_07980, partial [Gemmatimonadaceae bacterium]|nr:hypothetical protein [Gemmatimonadaceae bacterium]
MAALAATAVLITLVALLVPTYGRVRSSLTRERGDRLVGMARFIATELPPALPVTGDSGAASARLRVQELLRRARTAGGGSELRSIDVVAREAGGRYRYLVRADGDPSGWSSYAPPAELRSLTAGGKSGSVASIDAE